MRHALLAPFMVLLTSCTTTLYSPTLQISTAGGGGALDCNFVNVSAGPRSGTIQIVGLDGKVLSSVSYNTTPAGGGTGDAVSTFSGATEVTTAYCKMTVDAGKDGLRASFSRRDTSGNTVASVDLR